MKYRQHMSCISRACLFVDYVDHFLADGEENICLPGPHRTAQMGSFEIKLNSWLETHRSVGKQEKRCCKEAEWAKAPNVVRGDCPIFQSARRGRKWSESEGRASVNSISNQKEWKSACLECVNTRPQTLKGRVITNPPARDNVWDKIFHRKYPALLCRLEFLKPSFHYKRYINFHF